MGEYKDAFDEGAREPRAQAEVIVTLLVLGAVVVSIVWAVSDLALGNHFVRDCLRDQGTAVYTEEGHTCYPPGTVLR